MRGEVTIQRADRVAHLQLSKPARLNALSPEMCAALEARLDDVESDAKARVLILSGAGRAFSVGFDLGAGAEGFRPREISVWEDRERLRQWTRLLTRIWNFPKPIIAQVHGYCMAGANLFPLAADITIIAEDCVVGWPKLPMGGGFVAPLFAMRVGPSRAKLMEYDIGRQIDGRTAAAWGYVAEAVPAPELATHCATLAREIARLPSSLLHLKKASINRVFDQMGFQQVLEAGAEWDALAHVDPAVTEVRDWVRENGMKEAIARFRRDGL